MKTINKVNQTTDYSIFKTLEGNRVVNKLHIERLKKSFKENYLFSPIIVNEKYEIIDGQHRFETAKFMNLPINFIVVPGYGLNEVQRLNANSRNWNKKDYLEAYCDLGVESYLTLKSFMNDFNEFSLSSCEGLLTNTTGGVNNRSQENIDGKSVGRKKNFENGFFDISDLNYAYELAEKLRLIGRLYPGYTRGVFVSCFISLMKNPNFDFKKLLNKLQNTPQKLEDRKSISDYKQHIEDIYNYKSRKKVNLRF